MPSFIAFCNIFREEIKNIKYWGLFSKGREVCEEFSLGENNAKEMG